MRLVLQRVAHASVTIDGKVVGKIDKGILALVGMNTEMTKVSLKECLTK